jgi:hypothetical protein
MFRAPRPATGGVNAQLLDFEDDLRNALIASDGWGPDGQRDAMEGACMDLSYRYRDFENVTNLLTMGKILFRAVITASINTMKLGDDYNEEPSWDVVIDNVFGAYFDHIYSPLRCEMLAANHHIGVIQRNWRRCVLDPEHPACRRRLEWEFNDLMTTTSV